MRVSLLLCAALLALAVVAYLIAVGPPASSPRNVNGTLYVSSALGDHMVLQRAPFASQVWGTAEASGVVTVSWAPDLDSVAKDHKVLHLVFVDNAIAGNANGLFSSSGEWTASLPAIEAGGPYKLTVTSNSTGNSISFSDVMFGDVYLCGGQSNMQFAVSQSFDGAEEIERAGNFTDIRVFTVGQEYTSSMPLNNFAGIEQGWSVASSKSIGAFKWTHMSAVCWYFGKDMYEALEEKVPIGLMSSNWRGSTVQAWSSPDALEKCQQPNYSKVHSGEEEHYASVLKKTASTTDELEGVILGGSHPHADSVLWNAMIVPFLKMRFLGAIWYQGEENISNGPQYYACQFPAMIADWRTKMQLPNLYFGFVQLAPYKANGVSDLAELRLSQMAALGNMSAMAVTIDTGDINSPYGDIHPQNKSVVGKRLSLSARAMLFQQDVQFQSPIALTADVSSSSADGSTYIAVISFSPPTVGPRGIVVNAEPTIPCPSSLQSGPYCVGLQFRDSNGLPMGSAIDVKPSGEYKLQFTCSGCTSKPAYVSYAFGDWPLATLYGSNALPVAPFYLPVQ